MGQGGPRSIGVRGPGSPSRVRFSQLQETRDPLLLLSQNTGQVEQQSLGPHN